LGGWSEWRGGGRNGARFRPWDSHTLGVRGARSVPYARGFSSPCEWCLDAERVSQECVRRLRRPWRGCAIDGARQEYRLMLATVFSYGDADRRGSPGIALVPNPMERPKRRIADAGTAQACSGDRNASLYPIAHDSYLINLAAPDEALWRKSLDSFVVELRRAEFLGIPYVVAHPGAYTSSSEEAGLRAPPRASARRNSNSCDHSHPSAPARRIDAYAPC